MDGDPTKPSEENTALVGTQKVLWLLSLLAAALLVLLIFYTGDPKAADWWLSMIPLGIWIVGPVVTPWLIARKRPKPIVVIAMLVFLILSSALSAILYYDAFFVSTSSTAGLILLFLPVLQWIVLAIVAAGAIAASVWNKDA